MSVILIFAVLTAYPTAPFASAHSHVSPTLEAQRHCERLLQASSGNSTTNPGAALDLDAVASVGTDQPADATDKDQSKGDAEPLKVTLKSFYLCHPTSSKVFLRCDVRADGTDDGKTSLTRLSLVQGAVLSCEPGTFFNSVIKVRFLLSFLQLHFGAYLTLFWFSLCIGLRLQTSLELRSASYRC